MNTPRNLYQYEGVDDIALLAARLCFRVAKAHAFDDGNKRTAFLSMFTFLVFNEKNIKEDIGFTLALSFLSAYDANVGNFDKCSFGLVIKEAVGKNNEGILTYLLKESIAEKPLKQAFFENQKNKNTT